MKALLSKMKITQDRINGISNLAEGNISETEAIAIEFIHSETPRKNRKYKQNISDPIKDNLNCSICIQLASLKEREGGQKKG